MKERTLTALKKEDIYKFPKLFILFLMIGLLNIACHSFQANQSSAIQENKNEQLIEEQKINYEKMLPFFVSGCNDKNKWIHEELDFPANLYNPNFLRGDFDGDGNNDYAIVVESRKDKREGILVCFRNKETKAVLLGLDANNPPPFWRLNDWDVGTSAEINEVVDYKGNAINIKPKGESIVMKWEDALGIIYWDGKDFRWKEVILNDGN